MERKEPEKLGDILRKAIEESSLARQLDEVKAINAWPAVVGPAMASKSPRPAVKNGVMFVKIFSPPLRQELNMQRSSLAAMLNKTIGKDVIKEIRFIG